MVRVLVVVMLHALDELRVREGDVVLVQHRFDRDLPIAFVHGRPAFGALQRGQVVEGFQQIVQRLDVLLERLGLAVDVDEDHVEPLADAHRLQVDLFHLEGRVAVGAIAADLGVATSLPSRS